LVQHPTPGQAGTAGSLSRVRLRPAECIPWGGRGLGIGRGAGGLARAHIASTIAGRRCVAWAGVTRIRNPVAVAVAGPRIERLRTVALRQASRTTPTEQRGGKQR
jgi:hypothetical protein